MSHESFPAAPAPSSGTRSVAVRRVCFEHGALMDRHLVDDDLMLSHLAAVMSAAIPAGEEFVIDVIRRHRKGLEPGLRKDTNSLIGQEQVHSREHEAFNRALHRLGYPVPVIDRASRTAKAISSRLPARLQLAMVASIEHFTATLAEHVLSTDHVKVTWGDTTAREFISWHLYEELEHRSIAFDVMKAAGVSEADRHCGMRLTVALFGSVVIGGMLLSLATDRDTYRPRRFLRSLRRLRNSPSARMSGDLSRWYRPDFHPDERNIDAIVDRWRPELFEETRPAAHATMG